MQEDAIMDTVDFEILRSLGIRLTVDSEGFWHIPESVEENDE